MIDLAMLLLLGLLIAGSIGVVMLGASFLIILAINIAQRRLAPP